jgi:hypothetical protein
MSAAERITVGVVVERRKAANPWVDYIWRPVSVLPGEPAAAPWTVLAEEDGRTVFYAGSLGIELHPGVSNYYNDNLTSASPSIWVVLRSTEDDPPYRLFAATVDPAEGEAFTEVGTDVVEAVPMPDIIRDAVAAFAAAHPVERPFYKRKRERADPEAMARRTPGSPESRK